MWVRGYATSSHNKITGVRSLKSCRLFKPGLCLGKILVNCDYCSQKPVATPQCVLPAWVRNLATLKLPMLNMYSIEAPPPLVKHIFIATEPYPHKMADIYKVQVLHDVCAKSNQNTEQLCVFKYSKYKTHAQQKRATQQRK